MLAMLLLCCALCLVGEEEGGEGVDVVGVGGGGVGVHHPHPWASCRCVRSGPGRLSNPCHRSGVFSFHCQLEINTTSLNYKFNII